MPSINSQALKKVFQDVVDEIWRQLVNNKEFLSGMSLGAFLMTPAGRAIVKRAGSDLYKIAGSVKDIEKATAKDAWKWVLNKNVLDQSLAERARNSESKTGKVANAMAKAGAVTAAGKILGNYLGYTIAEDDNALKAWRIAFPQVFATSDIIRAITDKNKAYSNKKSEAKEVAAQVERAIKDAAVESAGEAAMKENDEFAKQHGFQPRPASPQAADQWKKEVERMKNYKSRGNHPIWYGKIPELVSTNLNYGVIKDIEPGYDIAIGAKVAALIAPPIREGKVSQAYKDQIDAIYIKLRGSNSGAYNYDAEDVGAYIECVRGLRATLRSLQRDLKLTNETKVYEAQTPNIYLTVAGYNAAGIADMKENRAIYASELNLLADTLEDRFPLPPAMTVIDRTDYISDMILKESDSVKSCWYIYSIDRIMTPSGNSDQKLVLYDTADSNFGNRLSKLRTAIDNMYTYKNAGYSTVTFTKVAGDIIRAYGEAALQAYPRIKDINTDHAVMIYDEYLLHQMQNTCGPQIDSSSWAMTCTTNIYDAVVSAVINIPGSSSHTVPVLKVPGLVDSSNNSSEVFVNTNKNSVSAIESYSLTRNIYKLKVDSTTVTYNTNTNATVYDANTDIIMSIAAYFYDDSGSITRFGLIHRGASNSYNLNILSIWSQIDYAPLLIVYNDSNNNGNNDKYLDIDNYALMSDRQFRVFNDVCTKSLYMTVPIRSQANFKAAKSK